MGKRQHGLRRILRGSDPKGNGGDLLGQSLRVIQFDVSSRSVEMVGGISVPVTIGNQRGSRRCVSIESIAGGIVGVSVEWIVGE